MRVSSGVSVAASRLGRLWNGSATVGSELLDQGPPGRLVVAADEPVLAVKERDAAEALNFFRLPEGSDPTPAVNTAADVAWYHTIELPDGTTDGLFDHRALVPHYGLPDDLQGKRALDVATFDGFWAFELERRGAEVTAIDLERVSTLDLPGPVEQQRRTENIDAPMGRGFEVARQALGSRAKRISCSVYDLNPDEFGVFDFVHFGDLLLHLRSPISALTAIRSVTSGRLHLSEVYHPGLPADPEHLLVQYVGGYSDLVWWLPSLEALTQMIADAGFRNVEVKTRYSLARKGETTAFWRAVICADA